MEKYKHLKWGFEFSGSHIYRTRPGFFFEAYLGSRVDARTYCIMARPPNEHILNIGFTVRLFGRLFGARLVKMSDIPDSSKQSTLHDSRSLKAENERLRAEAEDADLLLGPSWQEAVRRVAGSKETDVAGSLSIQCSKLSGDLEVSRAEVKRLREEREIDGENVRALFMEVKWLREAVDWVNTPHQCSPGTCGHQPASIHIDCADPWHRLPSQEISFSCPTCRVA